MVFHSLYVSKDLTYNTEYFLVQHNHNIPLWEVQINTKQMNHHLIQPS